MLRSLVGSEMCIRDSTGREYLDQGLDLVDQYAQPQQRDVSFQDQPFTTSPGGAVSLALPGGLGALAAVGGAVAARNFENIYASEGEYNPSETGRGLIPNGSIPGVNTPLAISEGAIPGTTVFSKFLAATAPPTAARAPNPPGRARLTAPPGEVVNG